MHFTGRFHKAFWIKRLLQEVTMNQNIWIYNWNWQRNIFSYYNHIVLDLLQTKAISTGKPVLANSWKSHSLILEGRGTVTFYRCLHSPHPSRVKSLNRDGPHLRHSSHILPRLCTLTPLAPIQPRRLNTTATETQYCAASSNSAWVLGQPLVPSNSRTPDTQLSGRLDFILKAALLQMVTIKSSQCFPPLFSPNTLWDTGLGALPKASVNSVSGHKSNTCQCQVLWKKHSNFSVDHTSCCLSI